MQEFTFVMRSRASEKASKHNPCLIFYIAAMQKLPEKKKF